METISPQIQELQQTSSTRNIKKGQVISETNCSKTVINRKILKEPEGKKTHYIQRNKKQDEIRPLI